MYIRKGIETPPSVNSHFDILVHFVLPLEVSFLRKISQLVFAKLMSGQCDNFWYRHINLYRISSLIIVHPALCVGVMY